MRIPRIYHPQLLASLSSCQLTEEEAHHLATVLRMREGDQIEIFDGSNYAFQAVISKIHKKTVLVDILTSQLADYESPLNIHLGQVISRGERMEFTIQKAVELGVNTITPLYSERCGVKYDANRMDKKVQQWQKIVIAACKQCGRNILPTIRPIIDLKLWCQEQDGMLKLNLHPKAELSIPSLTNIPEAGIRLLIGSEGGLSPQEIQATQQYGFTDILLGKRVLRTETAALVAVTALQTTFGDLR